MRGQKLMPRQTIFILVSLLLNLPQVGNSSGAAFAQISHDNTVTPRPVRTMRRLEREFSSPTVNPNNGVYGQTGTKFGGQYNSTVPAVRTQDSVINSQINTEGRVTSPNPGTKTDSMSDMSETEQMRLQNMMDQRSKAEQTMSNIMKKQSDTQNSIINNMK
jgi:hypothetical protein